jgi:cytochrome P450
MARFSDGADHRRRRDLVMRLLPPAAEVARAAGSRANDYLCRRAAPFDIMPMARSLPAEVLARALGLPPGVADRAAVLTGAFSDALTPWLLPRKGTGPDADTAAHELATLVAGLGSQDEEHVAAVIGILLQARDATAALIGTAVLAGSGPGNEPGTRRKPGQRVDQALRREAPVQCTRRTAMVDAPVGDAVIPAGAPVWIFVATAERGAVVPATFGTGPHGCPGAAHATAIARQVVAVLDADCWHPVAGQRVDFEPRPNIRVPIRVMVARS